MKSDSETLVDGRKDEALAVSNPSVNFSDSVPVINSDELPIAFSTSCECLKNLAITGISFFLFFSAMGCLTNLQSTMNAQSGIGTDSQAIVNLCSMVSCFFPQMMIGKYGAKSTYLISLLVSSLYIAANFYIRWDMMMTAAVLQGLANGPLRAAVSFYIDEMASRYARATDQSAESVKALFFGLFGFFGENTQVLGNSVSYFVLSIGNHIHVENVSFYNDCGATFLPDDVNVNNTNLTPPSQEDRTILMGAFMLLGILSVIAVYFLDPLKNDLKDTRGCDSVSRSFLDFIIQLRNPHQLLLIPLSVFCGIQNSFYATEFTQAYIACSWGVEHVGFVTICFGVCGALMSLLVGPLVKCISQMSVILLAAVLNLITYILLFYWEPSPEAPLVYFAFAGVWGMTDAIWWSQVAALYGLMFPNDREAAFSNFFFWSFLGYFMSYSYANYLTVAVKIYIMLVFLIVGITLYVIGQIKIKCFSPRGDYMAIEDS